ncbi:SusC/RagA family TonB-linked outer membrane protein [Mucilaginibacter terrae]|uniref:TonB-linked SusC/RagA family outer membrane protein n=1 Tax=Mucilaginibacter terrae TaxID=1955052 RepID=A0ABU3GQE3_9SPHI|nr:SusC/RagA family TonB-linked outer membrane protein [Mucilaginibacter terrae]MDT3402003.1 TonB-linked SusC/RagA family outer membrane protein [Mucilaginibacter terrae]
MIIIKNKNTQLCKIPLLALLLFFNTLVTHAQSTVTLRGTVTDKTGEPVIGATVATKGNNPRKTITDINGKFALTVSGDNVIVVVSYVGLVTKEIKISSDSDNKVILEDANKTMNEVVVVGYGQQKKISVVGAITQTTGKVLERTGGVTNLGMALTGNLPGVVTSSSTGMPGAEDPQILIRGQSSWNNSSPLILVDGIERSISSIDISSVESVSVLKDASATAVYGVRGANGVILVTTKQGAEGKPQVQVRSNVTTKIASRLPEKYDSYDALMIRNKIFERESIVDPNTWAGYMPKEMIDKYRNPLNADEWDRYPNVDWEKELFKSHAMSYNTAANVSGGSKFVKYFAGVDLVREGDLFKTFPNNRGYESNFGYNRTNVRSNLDFNLTKTTLFSTKLFGSNGVRQLPYNMADGDGSIWSSAYRTAPDTFRPIYSDGTYGYYPTATQDQPNAAFWLAYSGVEKRTSTQLTTDFILQQKLDMLTKGLSFRASVSLDNTFLERRRGINDQNNAAQRKYIFPLSGLTAYEQSRNTGTQFDFTEAIAWSVAPGEVDKNATYRNTNYQLQLNYARTFGYHDVTAMGLLQRQKSARGSVFANYREDWVFRTTYAFKSKYLFEANGAYNGSEKFGPDYRFAFFPSVSGGWVISNEKFMSKLTFVDLLKVRASWGRIGDDGFNSPRWPFRDSYQYSGTTSQAGNQVVASPYTIYRVGTMGNPNLSWETVEKRNLGFNYSFLKGKITGSVDIFRDKRSNIVIGGNARAIPSFYGFGTPELPSAPSANLGEVVSKGYEIELAFNQPLGKNARMWANAAVTHAQNVTNFRDDPELTPSYQKLAGYAIGQTRTFIDNGFLQSWDDIYGSTTRLANNQNRLPGDYNIIDFNGDGLIDDKDRAPFGYTGNPQNTYNLNVGFEWKRFSIFVQFYAVNNVTRQIQFPNFQGKSNLIFVEKPFWFLQDGGGEVPPSRYVVLDAHGSNGTRYFYDASYVRLKNAEIGYMLPTKLVSKIGLKNCRLYVNGNNLLLWTKMPDDRESNFSSANGDSSNGAYPTVRRFNLGLDITL